METLEHDMETLEHDNGIFIITEEKLMCPAQ